MTADLSVFLSILGLVLVLLLFVFVRRGSTYHSVAQEPARVRGRVHARIGSTVLLFYAILAVVASIGGWVSVNIRGAFPDGGYDLILYVAVMLRVVIGILLLAWLAWELDARYRGRWPSLDRHIERLLHVGQHRQPRRH